MKIAIITQPLRNNYGGLLQNYALQVVLRTMGHTPITFDQCWMPSTWKGRLKYRWIFKSEHEKGFKTVTGTSASMRSFIHSNIYYDLDFATTDGYCRLERRHKIDALILGSDQVWRPPYVLDMAFNFGAYSSVKLIISYAASLGVDTWEFSDDLTAQAKNWAKRISAVSVREASAVPLLKRHLGIDNPVHVLDPTMLLTAVHYRSLYSLVPEREPGLPNCKHVFAYILDDCDTANMILDKIIAYTHIPLFRTSTIEPFTEDENAQVSPAQWLKGIDEAAVVICDSFHGAVFSIIYHRSFWVLPNKSRGNTRLTGLLKMFGLEDRMLTSTDEPQGGWLRPINWGPVNETLRQWRITSLEFLTNALTI